ncbi:MAG: CBS domain-containing protein [Trueperaceae bacterium]|nr:CBS domain-containing protein [Trueperaceae bacterium]
MQVRRSVGQLLQDKGSSVWTVSPGATVFDALGLMADKNVGALIVTEAGRVVGIFSERDYARKVILQGHASRELAVRDIMTTRLVTVAPEQGLHDCMELMTEHRVRHLPVLDQGGALLGVVSIGDVVKAVMAEQSFLIEQLQTYISGGLG